MSALGHKRTFSSAKRDVRFTPESGHSRQNKYAVGQKRTCIGRPLAGEECGGSCDFDGSEKYYSIIVARIPV